MKYYDSKSLKEKLELIIGAIKFFSKNLLGHNIQPYDPLGYKIFFETFIKKHKIKNRINNRIYEL